MTNGPWGNDAGSFLVYVDEYREDLFSGRYYRPFDGESGRFGGLTQLLMQMEKSLDPENGPQSFQTIRSFSPSVLFPPEELELPLQRGAVANFSVRILFRRNASWQGSVTWLEGRQTESFRSVLELISLMSSAVAAKRFPAQCCRQKNMEQAE